MIQLPQLHESLLIANDRLVDRARRRARRFRLGLMTSAAVASVGGAAVAGTALWGPLGHEDGNRPTASSSPVPTDQEQLLGVLRRPQTVADRGAAARAVLGSRTLKYQGVRLAEVRTVGTDRSLVLVPVERIGATVDRPSPSDDALCISRVEKETVLQTTCFSTDDIRRGDASIDLAEVASGIVPDGVARVVVHAPGGGERSVPVSDNVFSVPTADIDPSRLDVQWLAASGTEVEPEGGRAMRVLVPVESTDVPDGFHQCGKGNGGIVPSRIACGEDARRYTPPKGTEIP